MKYEHDIRAIRRVDGNVSYWLQKASSSRAVLAAAAPVEEAIQNLIDPKGNTNGAKGLSDYTLRSLRIEDESDSEKHQGLAEKLQDPSVFCGDCKNYGRAERLQQRRRILCSVGTRTGRCGHPRRKGVTKAKEGHNRECKRQFPLLRPSFCIFCRKPSENVAHSLRSCLRSGIIQYTKQ